MFFHWVFCWTCPLQKKHTFLISIREYGFQQIHIQNFGCFQFYKACFSIGASAETGRLQENCILNIYFGILGLSENTSKCSVHFSFINHVSLVGLLLKHAGIRKPLFWTSIWDSGSQRKHIHDFAWFQFYKACVPIGTAAETLWHQESCVLNIYLGFWISTNTYPRFRSISVL